MRISRYIIILCLFSLLGCAAIHDGWKVTEHKDGRVDVRSPQSSTDVKSEIGAFIRTVDGYVIHPYTVSPVLKHLDGDRTLIWIGSAVIIISLLSAYLMRNVILGAVGGLLGASLIGIAYYPAISLVAGIILLITGIVYIIYIIRKHYYTSHCLKYVVKTIDKLPKDRKEELKSILEITTDEQDKKIITKLKEKK